MTNAGNCVINAQTLKSITSANLARLMGITPQQVMRLRKQKNIKLHTMEQLCEIFDITLDEFVNLD